ncbi:hypothetical protein ISS86_03345 [Candidatus Microgenomates bacterium]|nr:hypothetical protein [Candidatus Microgenomates bacterium]
MQIFLPQETFLAIKNTHIFIDTCILLDFANFKKKQGKAEFLNKLTLFTKNGCVFVTIMPVAVEFFLGSTQQDLKIKKRYFNQLIKTTLPVKIIKEKTIEDLILEYGRYARGNVSYVDLCLGAAIRQFPGSLLLTRNYKDFPLKIFDCRGVFTVHLNKEVRTYCFYEYRKRDKEKKAKKKGSVPF